MAYATIEQIATVLNMTPRMINRHVKENGMPRVSRGEYDLVKCVRWYIDYLKDQIDEARRGGETGAQADVRQRIAEANMAEIKLARMRAEVITMDDVLSEVEGAFRAVRDHFLFMPKSLSIDLASLSDAKEIEQYLRKRIHESLSKAASLPDRILRAAKIQDALAEGDGTLESAAQPDAVGVGGPVQDPLPRGKRPARKVADASVSKGNDGRRHR